MLRNMNSENVKVNKVELLTSASDVLRRKGGNIAWDEMMQLDKKTIQNNIFVFHIEANNSFKENVPFKVNKVEERVVRNKDKQRNNYYKVVEIEDITGRFGKHTLRTSEITSATTTSSFKNKLTEEYRKTLRNTERDTKELKTENKKLNKDLDEAKKIDLIHQQQATRKYAELNEKYVKSERKNEVLVVDNDKLNKQVVVLEKKVAKMSKASLEGLSDTGWKRLIKIIFKACVTGKTTEQIKEKVFEFLNEYSKDEE